jgi:hypothetical protein
MATNDANLDSPAQVQPEQAQPEPTPLIPEEQAARRESRLRALWTVGSILSIALNLILCVALLLLGNQLFKIKKVVGVDLLGGLYGNFVRMDQAHIQTTILVQDEIPIKFDLPISQDTTVITTQPAYIQGATLVNLSTGGLVISNAPADITLPAGTSLQVHLEMTVPVEKTIPVTLNVPVDIALDQTEMHDPLIGLQGVIAPYYRLLKPEWETCNDVPVLSNLGSACKLFFWGP